MYRTVGLYFDQCDVIAIDLTSSSLHPPITIWVLQTVVREKLHGVPRQYYYVTPLSPTNPLLSTT